MYAYCIGYVKDLTQDFIKWVAALVVKPFGLKGNKYL